MLPASQTTHSNHYIPQFYLKNWSQDGISVFTYSLLVPDSRIPYWNRRKIKSTAVWDDFYTRNEGTKEIDDFEKWFNKEFEAPVKVVFDNLLKGHNLNEDESIKLSRYIGAQYLRTPARLNDLMARWRSEMPPLLEAVLQKAVKELETNPQIKNSQPQIPEKTKLLPIKVTVNKEVGQIKVDSVVGKGMYLFALKHLLDKTVCVLEKHQWHVIHAADGVSFPTSDDPVICLNYNSDSDYDFKGGSQVHFSV